MPPKLNVSQLYFDCIEKTDNTVSGPNAKNMAKDSGLLEKTLRCMQLLWK